MGGFDWLGEFLTGKKPLHLNFLNFKRGDGDTTVDKRKTKVVTKDSPTTNTVASPTVTNVFNGPVIQLNVQLNGDGLLPVEALEQLRPIVDEFSKKQVSVLADTPKGVLNDINAHEQDDDVRGVLNFFKNRISPGDHRLLRTGLYVKHLHETGRQEEVKKFWLPITTSARERRIVELASTDYFSTIFRPMYKQFLKADSTVAQKRFDKEYESILTSMPFAVFVPLGMRSDKIAEKVTKLAISNIKYGVKGEVIWVHATGARPVDQVKEAVKQLRETFPSISTTTWPKGTDIIKASIEYRTNNLDPSVFEDGEE